MLCFLRQARKKLYLETFSNKNELIIDENIGYQLLSPSNNSNISSNLGDSNLDRMKLLIYDNLIGWKIGKKIINNLYFLFRQTRGPDGLRLHLRVSEPQPRVWEEWSHPEETALSHLLRAADGEDERRGSGGEYRSRSLLWSSRSLLWSVLT